MTYWIRRSPGIVLGLVTCPLATAAVIVDDSGSTRDGKVGGWSSIVARNGSAAISYYCESDPFGPNADMYMLRFAWNDGLGWQWTTVDSGGSDTSMARGTDGVYRVVYASWSGIGYAAGVGTTWTLSSVPIPGGVGPANMSMVLDANNYPHVAYMNFANGGDRALRYTYYDGTQWVKGGANEGIIDIDLWTPTIGFPSAYLALDSSSTPHIAFAQPSDPINAYGDMRYATLVGGAGGTWQQESLSVMGADPALAIGHDDVPRILFNGAAGIVYAYKSGGTWTYETIVANEWGSSPSLALSDADVPFASFGMTANEDLYVARREAGGWVVTRVDGDGTSDPHVILGRYGTSINVDETGAAHVSYQAIDIYGMTHRADLKYDGTIAPACVVFNNAPQSQSPCPGGSATFFAAASAAGPLTYSWQKDGQPLTDGPTPSGSTIAGASTADLTISNISSSDVGAYSCVASTGCGSATSAAAALTLGLPVIVSSPASTSACTSAAASFSVSVSGVVSTYEWRRDGVALVDGPTGSGSLVSGAATSSLTITGVSSADAGWYECVASNACGSAGSAAATLTVTTCGGGCLGDLNEDHVVNEADLGALLAHWAETGVAPDDGDIDQDGDVDESDLGILLANWLATCP
ncbi:MAG: immunoglobulin domain-containing protein [Phycisphaerae bacterium]